MWRIFALVALVLAAAGLAIWLNKIAWIEDPSLSDDMSAYDQVPGGIMTPHGPLSFPAPASQERFPQANIVLAGQSLKQVHDQFGEADHHVGNEKQSIWCWWSAVRVSDPLDESHHPVAHLVLTIENGAVQVVRCFGGGGRHLYPQPVFDTIISGEPN